MVAPITGPINKSFSLSQYHPYYGGFRQTVVSNRSYYRQKVPFNLPLTEVNEKTYGVYEIRSGHPYPWENYSWGGMSPGSGQPSAIERAVFTDRAYNAAYSKFRDAVRSQASWAVTLAERESTWSMIAERLKQFRDAFNAVRRGQFKQAAGLLGINPKAIRKMDLRKGAKNLGSNWLEYWFGWAPLVGDLFASVKILCDPIPAGRIRVSATRAYATRTFNNSGGWTRQFDRSGKVKCKIQAEVSVSNPNLYLLNQLGLTNPAVVALELVPYSWLLGWFVNLEAILSSWTDFIGLRLENLQRSFKSNYENVELEVHSSNLGTYAWRTEMDRFERIPGALPSPNLVWSVPERLSVTRALTLCGLLVKDLSSAR
jgi:hypothetical protein